MEQKWIKEMDRSAISIFGIRLVGMMTLVVVALTYVTAHELAMCKLADDNGIMGMVVAVPRYDLCFYMMSLRDHEEKKRSGDIYTATDTWMNEEYSASEQSTDPNVRKSWPCIQQYFHKTATIHRLPLGGMTSMLPISWLHSWFQTEARGRGAGQPLFRAFHQVIRQTPYVEYNRGRPGFRHAIGDNDPAKPISRFLD